MLQNEMQGAREANAADDQFARTRGSAAIAASSTRKLVTAGDVGQPATPTDITAVGAAVIVEATSITPRVSGKVLLHAHYKLTGDGTARTVTPTLAAKVHGVGVYVTAATGATVNVPAVAGTFTTDEIDFEVDGLTLNTAYDFALRLQADTDGHVSIVTGGAQLEAEEQPA